MGQRVLFGLVAFLTVSAIYLYAFPQQNVFYAVIVLLHLLAGTAATIVLLQQARQGSNPDRRGWSSSCSRYTTGL